MKTTIQAVLNDGAGRRIIAAAWVAVLLGITPVSRAALADGPDDCALCHQSEVVEWRHSPHAGATLEAQLGTAQECQEAEAEDCDCLSCHSTSFSEVDFAPSQEGVTCEACHGPYVEGHPTDAVMPVDVDSSVCSGCHVQTYQEWKGTPHGQASVQCIGCHRSHTQNLRLDDRYLCRSCHEEGIQDPGHVAHLRASVLCVDCHVFPAATVPPPDGGDMVRVTRSHEFDVAIEVCTGCHGANFHEETARIANLTADGSLPGTASPTAETDSPRLLSATFNALGLGMGVGGMIGIAFVLVVGHIRQREWRNQQ